MTEVESSYNMRTSSNSGFVSGSALQIRLDCSQLIEDIELFLRGSKIVIERDEKTHKLKTKYVPIGKPKANDLGIQAILNQISSIINPQVVQGNFPSDGQGHSTMYENYIEEVNVSFACTLMINLYNWEIREEDFEFIVNFIMNLVQPFMTRLIDNEERKSYENTIKHLESSKTGSGEEKGLKI